MKEDKQQYLRIKDLIGRSIKNELTEGEKTELNNWLDLDIRNQTLFKGLTSGESRLEELKIFWQYDERAALNKFLNIRSADNVVRLRKRLVWQYAAAAMFSLLSVGAYFLLHKKPGQQFAQGQNKDLIPGSNKAVLTIGNGQKIVLTQAKNGTLAVQGSIAVKKTASGQVTYQSKPAAPANAKIIYNTLTVPRGGKYNLTLADGTRVWLNAESSITYPVVFSGADREVSINGEAYFEVNPNKHLPFVVKSGNQAVEVLGTHFNINAYEDEGEIKTTLLEGSVKVSSSKNSIIIKPGEQADFKTGKFNINNVNTEDAVAWKNGFFHYSNADIQTIMRAYSRWYDVSIEYQGKIPARTFTIYIHRDVNATQALKILSYLKINYRIEGKKIIIINNNNKL